MKILEPGNINLNNRPRVKLPNGQIATVRTIGVNFDGREYVIPTISDDGRVMSRREAEDQFRKTGRHFGAFSSVGEATAFAQQLHKDQERMIMPPANRFQQFAPKPANRFVQFQGLAPKGQWYGKDPKGKMLNFAIPENATPNDVFRAARSAGVADPKRTAEMYRDSRKPADDESPVRTFFRNLGDTLAPVTDEIAAGMNAVGQTMFRDKGDKMFGRPVRQSPTRQNTLMENYTGNMRFLEDQNRRGNEANPKAATGGMVAALPLAIATAAETAPAAVTNWLGRGGLIARSAKAGLVGAPIAAATTYATSPVDNRTENLGLGTAIGTGLSVAGPTVAKVGGAAARAIDTRTGVSAAAKKAWARLTGDASAETAQKIDDEFAIKVLARKLKVSPDEMRARVSRFIQSGQDPSLVNALDDQGRQVLASLAARSGPGQQIVQEAAEAKALNLPDQLDRNMQRVNATGEANPKIRQQLDRPTAEMVDDLTETRSDEIERALNPIRNTPIPMNDRLFELLATPEANTAIGRAARTVTDLDTRTKMLALPRSIRTLAQSITQYGPAARAQIINDFVRNNSDVLTVDVVDRIARKMNAMAKTADDDAAPVLRGFARELRDAGRTAEPKYGEALDQYGKRSKSIEAVEGGQNFLKAGTTDEFADFARKLSTEDNVKLKTLDGEMTFSRNQGDDTYQSYKVTWKKDNGEIIEGSVSFGQGRDTAEVAITGRPGTGYTTQGNAGRAGNAQVMQMGEAIRRQFPNIRIVRGHRVSGYRQAAEQRFDREVNEAQRQRSRIRQQRLQEQEDWDRQYDPTFELRNSAEYRNAPDYADRNIENEYNYYRSHGDDGDPLYRGVPEGATYEQFRDTYLNNIQNRYGATRYNGRPWNPQNARPVNEQRLIEQEYQQYRDQARSMGNDEEDIFTFDEWTAEYHPPEAELQRQYSDAIREARDSFGTPDHELPDFDTWLDNTYPENTARVRNARLAREARPSEEALQQEYQQHVRDSEEQQIAPYPFEHWLQETHPEEHGARRAERLAREAPPTPRPPDITDAELPPIPEYPQLPAGGDMVYNVADRASKFQTPLPTDRQLGQMGARRGVQVAAGENPANAPGVARKIANAPEQHKRNVALYGEEKAAQLEETMAVSAEDVRNYADVAPRTAPGGGRTDDVIANDILAAAATAATGGTAAKMHAAMKVLNRLGVRERDVESILRMSIDPERTGELVALIEKYVGDNERARVIAQAISSVGGGMVGGEATSGSR